MWPLGKGDREGNRQRVCIGVRIGNGQGIIGKGDGSGKGQCQGQDQGEGRGLITEGRGWVRFHAFLLKER